jgi:glutaredoxin-like protein
MPAMIKLVTINTSNVWYEDFLSERTIMDELVVYGTIWCGDCRRARSFLDRNHVAYRWINIDADRDGEAYVFKVNRGMRSVPTIAFPDGSVLVEPSNYQLAEKLGLGVLI